MLEWSNTIGRIAGQREKRIDALFDRMATDDGSPEDIRALRELVMSEIRSSQRLRTLAVVITLGLTVFSVVTWQRNDAIEQRRRHAQSYYRESNVPVSFSNGENGDLRVLFSAADDVPDAVKDDLQALRDNRGGFGRHPGLGEGRELHAMPDFGFGEGLRYILRPSKDTTTIGQMTLIRRSGRLGTQRLELRPGDAEPRPFEDMPRFGIKVVSFDSTSRQRKWDVQFCEKRGSAWTCGPTLHPVPKSVRGSEQRHLFLTDVSPKNVYFVSIGLGEQGVGGSVWEVNARAIRLGLLDP